MYNVNVQVDDLNIISSQMVIVEDGKNIVIRISDEIILHLEFCVNSDGDSQVSIEEDKNDSKVGHLKIINLKPDISPAVLTPMQIGKIEGNELYIGLIMWNFSNNSSTKIINFTFYTRENAKK